MEELIAFAKALLGPEPGIALLLFILAGLALVAYWKEKAKGDKVSAERLKEAKEDTALLVDTVNEAVNTVRAFKESNESLKLSFENLTQAVRESHERPARSGEGG
jgi:hypothetical protein